MKHRMIIPALGMAMLAAGCGQTNDATGGSAAATTNEAGSAPAVGTTAHGSGEVKAVDAGNGKITLAHGPIPEAGWPAMTMEFQGKPEILSAVKAGDQVSFDLQLHGGSGEVTAIKKR